MGMEGPSFGDMIGEMPLFFKLFFGLIVTVIGVAVIGAILKAVSTGVSNQAADERTVPCRIVSKRTRVSGGSGDFSASTSYYLTFEFTDRSRLEFHVSAEEYGLLVEGDSGMLKYKGTRYKGFVRD